jgi:UrcA family protein
MRTLFKGVSVSACMSLAVLAAAAAAPSAHAEDVHIFVADLDLHSPQGMAVFNARVDAVARELCAGTERLRASAHSQCFQAVRDEAKENLTHEMDRMARQGEVKVASVRR